MRLFTSFFSVLVLLANTSFADIVVTGTGSVDVMADIAIIDLSIVTDDESATRALSSNNKQMREVFKVLEDNNILKVGNVTVDEVDGHFKTKRFQITRKYKYDAQRVRTPAGWIVVNQISVELEKTEKLATLLSKLSEIEDSQDLNINSISYGVKDKEKALVEARKRAVLNAIKKAKLYASTAGVTLGKVKSINESGGYVPNYRISRSQAFSEAGDSVPVTEGQEKISVNLTIVFLIGE